MDISKCTAEIRKEDMEEMKVMMNNMERWPGMFIDPKCSSKKPEMVLTSKGAKPLVAKTPLFMCNISELS